MKQQELLDQVEKLYGEAHELMKYKNSDYAGSDDALKNFRQAAMVAGVSTEEAILVRIGDKLARIQNLLHKEAEVSDESIRDTLVDACNYTAILYACLNNHE